MALTKQEATFSQDAKKKHLFLKKVWIQKDLVVLLEFVCFTSSQLHLFLCLSKFCGFKMTSSVNNQLEAFDTKWLFWERECHVPALCSTCDLDGGQTTECCDVHTGFKSLTSAKLWCHHLNLIHSNYCWSNNRQQEEENTDSRTYIVFCVCVIQLTLWVHDEILHPCLFFS